MIFRDFTISIRTYALLDEFIDRLKELMTENTKSLEITRITTVGDYANFDIKITE